MPIERALGHPHHDKFVGELVDRFKFLFLQFTQIPINSEVSHMFCILFDFVDEVLIGVVGVSIGRSVGTMTAHQYFLAHQPEFLDLSLEYSILGDVGFVDEVEFCLD